MHNIIIFVPNERGVGIHGHDLTTGEPMSTVQLGQPGECSICNDPFEYGYSIGQFGKERYAHSKHVIWFNHLKNALPDLVEALEGVLAEIPPSLFHVRKDFSKINALARASKVLHGIRNTPTTD